jgi:hypothetical protein
MRRGILRAIACAVVCSSMAAAQQSVTGATLTGTVSTNGGTSIRNGHATLTSLSTGRASAQSAESGRFSFVVAPGTYRLRVEADGFGHFQREVTLLLGQALELPVKLALVGAPQTVTVTATTPTIETVRTQISSGITPNEVQNLPLNGRNYLDLALLAPNVSRTNTGTNQRFAETSAVPGTGISVAGQRNLNNTFIVDGLSANDDAAELAGTFYSQEVVGEFQVVTSGVAEFGRSSAGAINIVTRSGANQVHGDVYGFLRNRRLDATNPLTGTKLPLTQTQYGASVGGPLIKTRTFYFANFEQTRQNTAGVVTIDENSASAINAQLNEVGYPGTQVETGTFPSALRSTNFFGKLDHQWANTVQSSFRYSIYDVDSENARNAGGLNATSRGSALADRDQTFAANTLFTLSPRTLEELRIQFTRSRLAAPINDVVGPAVNISGIANFGTATSSPTARDIDLFQIVNTVSHERGAHALKAGADYLHNRITIDFPGATQGVYTFSNLTNFLSGQYVNFQQAFGAPSTTQGNPNVGAFVEDSWNPRRGLTVNAGIRYDAQILASIVQTDSNNVAPRIGISWDPWRNGKMVIRANYGLYYDRIPLRALSNALQRDGINYKVALVTPSMPGAPIFPEVITEFPSGVLTGITSIDEHIPSSYSQQASVQVERELTRSMSLSLGYMYLRGRGLIMSRNINVPTTADASVPNLGRADPRFANNSQYQAIGDSWFDGMTVEVTKRQSSWSAFRLSYTFSKALDTSGNFFFSSPQDNFNITAEKGRSDNDQRHRLSVSGTLSTRAMGWRSVWSVLARNWDVSWIYSYVSALPFNVLAGADLNGDTNSNDRPQGVGRNTGDGFDFQSLDLRLSRTVAVRERVRLHAFADGFNVLNRRNNMVPNNVYGTGTVPRASFGQPTAVGDARQVQLGLKVAF